METVFITTIFALLVMGPYKKNPVNTSKENGALVVKIDNELVLAYQFETVDPPAGIDSSFQRSGYIHPLKTMGGHTLTQILPKDHYHHYDIWNPWTHVLFENDTLDSWNLGRKQGTVRFAGLKKETENGNWQCQIPGKKRRCIVYGIKHSTCH